MKLNAAIIKDKDDGFFIGYIIDYPGIVVQGSSIDDIKHRMSRALDNFIDYFNKSKNLLSYSDPLEYSK